MTRRERSALETKLGFRIEVVDHERGSLIWSDEDGTERAARPATVAEIHLWKALVEEFGEAASGIVDAHKSLNPFGTPKEEA